MGNRHARARCRYPYRCVSEQAVPRPPSSSPSPALGDRDLFEFLPDELLLVTMRFLFDSHPFTVAPVAAMLVCKRWCAILRGEFARAPPLP
jgi:hypothetical protein